MHNPNLSNGKVGLSRMSLKAQRGGLLGPQAPDLALAKRQPPRRQAREVSGRPRAGAGA